GFARFARYEQADVVIREDGSLFYRRSLHPGGGLGCFDIRPLIFVLCTANTGCTEGANRYHRQGTERGSHGKSPPKSRPLRLGYSSRGARQGSNVSTRR